MTREPVTTSIPAEVCTIVPFWSQAGAMNYDSNYTFLRRVLPKLADALPSWLWLVFWPQKSRGLGVWRYVDDGLFEQPRIDRFPWPYDTQMRTSVLEFDGTRLQELEQRFAPTVFWLHQVELGAAIADGYKQSWAADAQPAVVAQHHYIIHPSLPYRSMFSRQWYQMGGSIASDIVICNSEYTRQMMRESFGEWLIASKLRELDEKTRVVKFGLVDETLTNATIREHPKPVILYNHRFEVYKRPEVTAAALMQLRQEGYKFEVWVTQQQGQRLKDFPADRLVGHPNYAQYVSNISVPAVNTLNTMHETFCISALDSLALGHLLVAPRALTFPELVPKGYPFLFDSPSQQVQILRYLLNEWPSEYERWRNVLRAHVRNHFGIDNYVQSYARVLIDAAQHKRSQRVRAKPETARSLDAFMTAFPRGVYSVSDLCARLRKATNLGEQACPNRRCIREVTARGARLLVREHTLHIAWKMDEETQQ